MADLVISNLRSQVPGLVVQRLAALNLCLHGAEITGLNGPSGSGKSLLLRAIADLDPSMGEVSLADCSRTSMPAHEWRKRVAYLPTESGWWFETVGEHFLQTDIASLQKLGFEADVLSWKITRISSGEKQRLALVRSLSREPEALLLDEPTAALDESHTLNVEQLVSDYMKQRNAPVFWVSHDPGQLNRLTRFIINIQPDGSIREQVR
ncbi:MAG TPA: ATP-binding cassette domain-containing protein [Gammaproteobacteria bacterium]|nr:ATP-binding cassette domain-containing protein [Gammaproteobacteria bacterium]